MLTMAHQDWTDSKGGVSAAKKKLGRANVLVSSSRPDLTAGGRGPILPWNWCSKAVWMDHFLCMMSG